MLLANSRPHWWSSVHCVALERIGDRIAVHDFGLGFGSAAWTTYPLVAQPRPSEMPRPPSAADNLASVSDNLGSTVDADLSWDNAAAEALAVPLEDLASDLVVGALNARKAQRIVERLRALLSLTAEQRLQAATRTYVSLGLEQVQNKASSDRHWTLSGVGPRARFYVAARKRDDAAVSERLASLVR